MATTIKKGSNGTAVKELQQKLVDLGYDISVDGIFGTETLTAVKKYQFDNNLTVDGIVGNNTWTSLNSKTSSNSSNDETEDTSTNTSYSNTNNDERYGEKKNSDDEESAEDEVDWALDQSEDVVSNSFLKLISSDADQLAFYINAIAYGGYTVGDVVNDIKRLELIKNGDTSAKNLTIIDADSDRSDYYSTTEGKAAAKLTKNLISYSLDSSVDSDILNYGLNMPDELFEVISPILDPESDEYKEEIEDLVATYSDLTDKQIQATTEQEKAIADSDYATFKENIEKKYGIILSDNADTAWAQIESLKDASSTRGLTGSGIEQEAIEDELKSTRKANQRSRDEKLTTETSQKKTYYTNSATADEIAKLSDAELQEYGLKPSDDILAYYSISNLKEEFPEYTTDQLKALRNSVLDENGNYRSALYKTQYTTLYNNLVTKIQTAKSAITKSAEQDEENAAEEAGTTGEDTVTTTGIASNSQVDSSLNNASTAAANISKSLSNNTSKTTNTNTTTTPTTKTTKTPTVETSTTTPKTTTTTNTTTTPTSTTKTSSSSGYTIKYGDTLSAIAKKYGTTVSALASLNNISNPDKIIAGKTIKVS